jgi:hypothetical protein
MTVRYNTWTVEDCVVQNPTSKVLSSEIQQGSKPGARDPYWWIYCRQVCFLNFKGTPSREEHKTGFSVLTTNELNLLAEFTKSCKRRPPYNELRNLASPGWWSYGPTPVTYNHQLVQISRDSWILSMYGTTLHRTIILQSRSRTVLSSAGPGNILHVTEFSS